MISVQTLQISLISNLLNCGSYDAMYFIDIVNNVENKRYTINGTDSYLYFVDKEGKFLDLVFDQMEDLGHDKSDLDSIITVTYLTIIGRISEIFELSKHDIDLNDYTDLFINSCDSHLKLTNDFDDVNLSEDCKNEIINIIRNFN